MKPDQLKTALKIGILQSIDVINFLVKEYKITDPGVIIVVSELEKLIKYTEILENAKKSSNTDNPPTILN